MYAAGVLGQRKTIDAVPELEKLLNDEEVAERQNHPVSFTAAMALYNIGTDNAYKAITSYFIEQLSNTKLLAPGFGNRRMCDSAAEVLEQIGSPIAVEAVKHWHQEQEKY